MCQVGYNPQPGSNFAMYIVIGRILMKKISDFCTNFFVYIRKEECLQLRMLLGSFVLRVEKKALEQRFTIRAELESSMQLGH